jgi:hypothetical protein
MGTRAPLEDPMEVLRTLADTFCRLNGTDQNLSAEEKLALLQDHEDTVFAAIEGEAHE